MFLLIPINTIIYGHNVTASDVLGLMLYLLLDIKRLALTQAMTPLRGFKGL
jgi:hypothetical protein